jgi:hypothetical protein
MRRPALQLHDDVRRLHQLFPEAFDNRARRPEWKDWRVLPIGEPDSMILQDGESEEDFWDAEATSPMQLVQRDGLGACSLDALAYYLPFHYYDFDHKDSRPL